MSEDLTFINPSILKIFLLNCQEQRETSTEKKKKKHNCLMTACVEKDLSYEKLYIFIIIIIM